MSEAEVLTFCIFGLIAFIVLIMALSFFKIISPFTTLGGNAVTSAMNAEHSVEAFLLGTPAS